MTAADRAACTFVAVLVLALALASILTGGA